jgi:hypothetical protein
VDGCSRPSAWYCCCHLLLRVLSLFMSALLSFLGSTFRSISFAGHVSPMVELKTMVEWRSAEGLCNS